MDEEEKEKLDKEIMRRKIGEIKDRVDKTDEKVTMLMFILLWGFFIIIIMA